MLMRIHGLTVLSSTMLVCLVYNGVIFILLLNCIWEVASIALHILEIFIVCKLYSLVSTWVLLLLTNVSGFYPRLCSLLSGHKTKVPFFSGCVGLFDFLLQVPPTNNLKDSSWDIFIANWRYDKILLTRQTFDSTWW